MHLLGAISNVVAKFRRSSWFSTKTDGRKRCQIKAF